MYPQNFRIWANLTSCVFNCEVNSSLKIVVCCQRAQLGVDDYMQQSTQQDRIEMGTQSARDVQGGYRADWKGLGFFMYLSQVFIPTERQGIDVG